MKTRTSNLLFWPLLAAGALAVTIQTVALYGWLAAPLGIGSGASLGAVVYYLLSMLLSALRWLGQQRKRR